MNTQTLTIKVGETTGFETLSITNTGSGRQLLMSKDGGDGDEVYFASIELQAEWKEKLEKHVMGPRGDEPVDFVYDKYLIHTKSVDWNGESVTLEVMLNTDPRRITIRRDEIVSIGDISIKNTPMGHKMMEDGTEEYFVMLTFSKGNHSHYPHFRLTKFQQKPYLL